MTDSTRDGLRFGQLLLLAVFFGLAGGLLEGVVVALAQMIPGWITWQMRFSSISLDLLWTAPLFYAALFLLLSSPLLAVGFWVRSDSMSRLGEMAAVFLFGTLGAFAALSASGRLYRWACALLAVGLAVRLASWFRAHGEQATRRVRQTVVPIAIVVLLTGIATIGWGRWREHRRYAALPPATQSSPNVMLLVFDTLRADHLSSYGYPRPTTPRMDALAQQGVLFENAFATSPWTVPSHATLMTGLQAHEHKADHPTPFLSSEPRCLAEALAARGYATAGFTGNTWWITRDAGFARGFVHFEDYSLFGAALRTVYGRLLTDVLLPRLGYRDLLDRKRASDINGSFLRWLDAHRDRPFFAFMNYLDVHGPYVSPDPYLTRFMDEAERGREARSTLAPPLDAASSATADGPLLRAAYDGALAFLDEETGTLVKALEARGLLDKTLLVLTSDHGEGFGEHGLFMHGHSLYADQVHIPLIFRLPGRAPAGLRVAAPTSLRDVPATIMSLAFPQESPSFPGLSLARFWQPAAASTNGAADTVLAEAASRGGLPSHWPLSKGRLRSLVTDQWHFILREDGVTELYDRRDDAQQLHNLADTPAGREIVHRLMGELDAAPAAAAPRSAARDES